MRLVSGCGRDWRYRIVIIPLLGVDSCKHLVSSFQSRSTESTEFFYSARYIMASDTIQPDYEKEKQQVSHHIEHANPHHATDLSLESQHEQTDQGVDMNNAHALKGDDSDGKVEWSVRSIFAAIFLAALYTGTTPPSSSHLHPIPNPN